MYRVFFQGGDEKYFLKDHVMDRYKKNIEQFRAYILISIIIVIEVMLLNIYNPVIFKQYFGDIAPVPAFLSVVVLGFLLFLFCNIDNHFSIISSSFKKGISYALLISILFFIPIIIIDIKIPFPEKINASFPESILFYTSIGFFIEIAFHVMPMIIFFDAVKLLKIKSKMKLIIWTCIAIVALIEPIFQLSMAEENIPLLSHIYVFVYFYLINISGLLLFTRYDFFSMYFLRFFFYLFIHIIWGAIQTGIV